MGIRKQHSLGQFYQIHVDNRLPFYYVMGGLQDNGSWTGPSRTREPAGILNDDWRMVSFGDGFYTLNHPDDPEIYISESQGGSIVRTDFRTREQQEVNPWGRGSGDGPAVGENSFQLERAHRQLTTRWQDVFFAAVVLSQLIWKDLGTD